jgi:hypothetical protein
MISETPNVDVLYVLAVDPDRARVGVVQPHQQLRERRLAGPGRTDQADRLAGSDREAHVVDNRLLVVVAERDVLVVHPAVDLLELATGGAALNQVRVL